MKRTLVPAVIVIGLAVVLVVQLVNKGAVQCRICLTFNGQRQCATARGDDRAQAEREAQESACSLVAHGVSERMSCPRLRPDIAECTPP